MRVSIANYEEYRKSGIGGGKSISKMVKAAMDHRILVSMKTEILMANDATPSTRMFIKTLYQTKEEGSDR